MDRTNRLRTTLGSFGLRRLLWVAAFGVASAFDVTPVQAQELCGGVDYPFPYTDVVSVGAPFCPGIMEAYVTAVSEGTTPTTFSPNNTVTRVQMTTFLQRSLDQNLRRSSRRAAFEQWWTPQDNNAMQTLVLAGTPQFCLPDGENIWVSDSAGRVAKIDASTGTNLAHWTGAANPQRVLVAAGKIFVAGKTSPGNLYAIDPTQPPGAATLVTLIGANPIGIAFDGTNVWTANNSGSVSIITPAPPYTVTTVTTGFSQPYGILYENISPAIWVTDYAAGLLLKLTASGTIIQTVAVGSGPTMPVFDGTNIWVPNSNDNSITVVSANTGNVVATIIADASNQLSFPTAASFDGERILVTNLNGSTVTVFKAADLSFIANVSTGPQTAPSSACSDGVNFWIATDSGLLRF